MQTYLRHIIPNFILMSSMLIIWHIFLNKKINLKNYKLYITLIGVMIVSIINYLLVNNFIRMVVLVIIFMFFFKFLFKENIQKTIITPIFYQIIAMISETIYAVVLTVVFKANATEFLETFIGILVTNIVIAILSVLLSKIKFVQKLYIKLLKFTDRINYFHLLFLSILVMLIENVLLMSTYYTIKFEYFLLFNSIMTIVCFIIAFSSLRTQNKFNKVSDKYSIAIKSLSDYENMMNRYKISNHENKNLLLTIRAMILNKEKDIPKFIDTMIEDKYEDDEKLLFKMAVIPSGGLRATIYSEIMKIRDNNIDYNLIIDKRIKTVDLIEVDTNTIIDACKIIGVFIDNSIDELKTNKKRNKNIAIEIFLDNNFLNIKVSNNYSNHIDINNIYNNGYTTKGVGRGYGLTLVQKIVENNKHLNIDTEISKDLFKQTLKLKIKSSN